MYDGGGDEDGYVYTSTCTSGVRWSDVRQGKSSRYTNTLVYQVGWGGTRDG